MFDFSLPIPVVVQGLIAVVLPILVGLVTNRVTASDTKAILLLVLSTVTSGLTEFGAAYGDHPFDVGLWLAGAVLTFVGGVAVHYGLWKPVGISEAVQESIQVTQPKAQPRGENGRFAKVDD